MTIRPSSKAQRCCGGKHFNDKRPQSPRHGDRVTKRPQLTGTVTQINAIGSVTAHAFTGAGIS